MTAFFIQVIVAGLLLILLHVSALGLAGLASGSELLELSFGTGKAIFRRGKLKIGSVPLGGYAKFSDTRETPDADPATAFNRKPAYVQALVQLVGCASLVVLAALILAGAGVTEFVAGFRQVIVGAFAPRSTAQEYIQALHDLSVSHGFLAVLGVLAAKVAAVNLLPLPFLNGGQALLAFVPGDPTVYPDWQLRWMQIAIFPYLAMMGSWAYALVFFAIGGP